MIRATKFVALICFLFHIRNLCHAVKRLYFIKHFVIILD